MQLAISTYVNFKTKDEIITFLSCHIGMTAAIVIAYIICVTQKSCLQISALIWHPLAVNLQKTVRGWKIACEDVHVEAMNTYKQYSKEKSV